MAREVSGYFEKISAGPAGLLAFLLYIVHFRAASARAFSRAVLQAFNERGSSCEWPLDVRKNFMHFSNPPCARRERESDDVRGLSASCLANFGASCVRWWPMRARTWPTTYRLSLKDGLRGRVARRRTVFGGSTCFLFRFFFYSSRFLPTARVPLAVRSYYVVVGS